MTRRTIEVRGGSTAGRKVFGWRRHERARVYVVAAQMALEGGRPGVAARGGFGGRHRIGLLAAYMKEHDAALHRELKQFFATDDRLENALYNRGHKAFYDNTAPHGAGRFARSSEHYRNDPKLAADIPEAERIVAKLAAPSARIAKRPKKASRS